MRPRPVSLHHLGLVTYDYDACVDFYTRVLEWEIVWQDLQTADDGTVLMRHVFFDVGDGSMVAFMCSTPENPDFPPRWEADLNKATNVFPAAYHFAFAVGSMDELLEWQQTIRDRGCDTTEIVDHGWCKSIYFRAPDGVVLELTISTRAFNDDDKLLKKRAQPKSEAYESDPQLARRDWEICGFGEDVIERLMVAMQEGADSSDELPLS